MKSKNIKKMIVSILFCMCIICGMFYIRHDNAEKMAEFLESPATIFNGSYDIDKNNVEVKNGIGHTEINIRFSDENIGYDEMDFSLNKDGKLVRSFNSYYIKTPETSNFESEEEIKTIWYLCRYDGDKSIELLDENNEIVGTISYSLSEKDLFGKQEIEYSWTSKNNTVSIYKAMEASYSFGTSYLESKYCSGDIE